MSTLDLRKALEPLFKLSKKLDNQFSPYTGQFRSNESRRFDDGINELNKLNQEVDQLHIAYKETLLNMSDQSKLFKDVGKCLNQSFELADACVSIIEAKLLLKGFDPPEIINDKKLSVEKPVESEDSNKTKAVDDNILEEFNTYAKNNLKEKKSEFVCLPSKEVNDKTFFIKPVAKSICESTNLKTNSKTVFPNGMLFDLPDSPKLPELEEFGPYIKQTDQLSSPVNPVLDDPQKPVNSFQPVNIESMIETVSLPKDLKIKDGGKINSFFPDISSPVTPNLTKEVPLRRPIGGKLYDKLDDDEDDDLVIHCRDSFLRAPFLSEDSPITPECTVNLLKSDYKEINMKNLPSRQLTASDQNSMSSPDAPELSVMTSSENQKTPVLLPRHYNQLSSDIKRLVTYEQAHHALKCCHERAHEKNSRVLTSSELEKAIGFGGRTKCVILILRTLNFIRRIVGTDMYEISS